MRNQRKTKIVATIGPGSIDILPELVKQGVDCFRLNCSHASKETLSEYATKARLAAKQNNCTVPLLFDLQGPKIRFSHRVEKRYIQQGDNVVFSGPLHSMQADHLEVAFDGFVDLVSEKSEIVVGDGVPRFKVESIEDGKVFAKATAPGDLGPRKGVNITFTQSSQPAITSKDIEDLQTAIELDADFVALSFVRGADDIKQLKQLIQDQKSSARVIAKIEKVEAYNGLEDILQVSDGIMVARGDYGIEAGVAGVPLMQKDTIRRSVQAGKLVITATQMLESMIESPLPTRAEAADVANAVLDQTSAVMLSGETAVGKFAKEAIQNMNEIILSAEKDPSIYFRNKKENLPDPAEAVMYAAVGLAQGTDAEAMLIPTATGRSARICSKWRPKQNVYALCHNKKAAAWVSLEWGIYAYLIGDTDSVDELVATCLQTAHEHIGLESDKHVVLTSGESVGKTGTSNLITLKKTI